MTKKRRSEGWVIHVQGPRFPYTEDKVMGIGESNFFPTGQISILESGQPECFRGTRRSVARLGGGKESRVFFK